MSCNLRILEQNIYNFIGNHYNKMFLDTFSTFLVYTSNIDKLGSSLATPLEGNLYTQNAALYKKDKVGFSIIGC